MEAEIIFPKCDESGQGLRCPATANGMAPTVRRLVQNPFMSALYTALTTLFGVGLNLIEFAIVDPQRLNNYPFDVLAVQYELLIASGGVLVGAHFVANSELSGRINRPLFGLLLILRVGVYSSSGIG